MYKMFRFGGEAPGTFDQCVMHQKGTGHDEESARKICGQLQADQEKTEKALADEQQKKRSVTHEIEIRSDGHGSPPKDMPESASEYADPVNYMYPTHDATHVSDALARFAQFHGSYSENAQKKVFERIVRAAIKLGIDANPTEKLANLLPQDLQAQLSKTGTAYTPPSVGTTDLVVPTTTTCTDNVVITTTSSNTSGTNAVYIEVAKQITPELTASLVEKSAGVQFFVPFQKDLLTLPGKDLVIRSVIYPAERVDAHNEYATANDLEKAAHGWMLHSREMNIEHTDRVAEGIKPAESYIAKDYDPDIDAHPGDWCGVFYASEESTKQAIASGVFKGFSIEGCCTKILEGTRKRMSNILVTKISLVKDPATMLQWVAKGRNPVVKTEVSVKKEGYRGMETLKKHLNTLQEQLVKLSGLTKSNIPQVIPTFKAIDSEQEREFQVLHAQSEFLTKLVANTVMDVEVLVKRVPELEGELNEATELVRGLQELNDVFARLPEVKTIQDKLLAEIIGQKE